MRVRCAIVIARVTFIRLSSLSTRFTCEQRIDEKWCLECSFSLASIPPPDEKPNTRRCHNVLEFFLSPPFHLLFIRCIRESRHHVWMPFNDSIRAYPLQQCRVKSKLGSSTAADGGSYIYAGVRLQSICSLKMFTTAAFLVLLSIIVAGADQSFFFSLKSHLFFQRWLVRILRSSWLRQNRPM